MQIIENVINYIIKLGAIAILPITILILGLIFKVKLKKIIQSSIFVGIGFVGINLVLSLLMDKVGKAAQLMTKNCGLNLSVIDGGWASASSIAWSIPIAALIIIICVIFNLLLISLKFTKTLYIDIWNFWHIIFSAGIVYFFTNNIILTLIGAIIIELIQLFMADRLQPLVENYFEIENVTLPTQSSLMWVPIGFWINKLLNKIPMLNKLTLNYENVQKKFGIFGDSTLIGVLLGIILGILAGYNIGEAFRLGIYMGAVMLLLPKMIKILLDGLLPISEAANLFLRNKFKDRQLYIGLDSALSLGDPAVITTSLILVPIMLILAAILPGNKVLPFGDLASIPFYIAFIVAHNKGELLKSVITGAIMIAITLYMATLFAPVYTEMLKNTSFSIPNSTGQISSITSGGNIFNFIILKILQFFKMF